MGIVPGIKKSSTGQSWDSQRNHSFHATIAFRDIDTKFNRIWSYLKSKEEPDINQHLLRITVIGAGGRIVCEYDLVLKRLLNRREALSKFWWRKTINRLRELQGLPPSLKSHFLGLSGLRNYSDSVNNSLLFFLSPIYPPDYTSYVTPPNH